MTSKTRTALHARHARTKRLLAFVLLLLVTYAATAEVTHKHGNLPINSSARAATPVINNGDAGSSLKDSRSFSDCLICQLQQHLSLSLFSATPQVVAPLAQAVRLPAAEFSYLSNGDAPRRGRAPPLASLS